MTRLVTFGDSYTFGDALPDIWPRNPESPSSNYAWPMLLADMLGYDNINLAKGGSSNTEILWRILNTSFLDDDLVIIGWTPHFVRSCFFEFVYNNTAQRLTENDPRYKDIVMSMSPTSVDSSARYRGDLNYDIIIKNYLTIQHGSLYLKNKKLRFYNLLTFKDDADIIEIPNLLNIPFTNVDKALDKKHPGPQSHKLLANLIFNKVGNNVYYKQVQFHPTAQ